MIKLPIDIPRYTKINQGAHSTYFDKDDTVMKILCLFVCNESSYALNRLLREVYHIRIYKKMRNGRLNTNVQLIVSIIALY